jgi:hypothetical protein
LEKEWRKNSGLFSLFTIKCRIINKKFVEPLRRKRLVVAGWLFQLKPILNEKMIKAKRILITTESSEIFIVRRVGKQAIHGFCEICAAVTEMVTLDQAVSFINQNTWNLIRLLESGAAHSIETADGHLLVCRTSLLENEDSLKVADQK